MQVQPRRPILRSRRLSITLWSLSMAALASGCAQQREPTESPDQVAQRETELAQLRRENASLRSEVQNLEERIRLLEPSQGGYASTSVGSVGYDSYSVDPGQVDEWEPGPGDDPRQLPVVKITPNGRSVSERPPASGSASIRPTDSISLNPAPQPGPDDGDQYVVDARGQDSWEQPVPDDVGEPASYRLVGSRLVAATKRSPPTKSSKGGQDSRVVRDYKAAMAVYHDGRYAEAEQAFASIVSAHPNHDYADNALYWQGEAAYDQAHYADALSAFTRVVERYGGGNKAPDALLKIGLCYARLGDQANARDVLTQLVAAYPRADASKIATRKLADFGD